MGGGARGQGARANSVLLSCAVDLKLLEKQSMENNNSIAFIINLRIIPGAFRAIFSFLPQSVFGGEGRAGRVWKDSAQRSTHGGLQRLPRSPRHGRRAGMTGCLCPPRAGVC